jgi:hypothetical protein
MTATKTTKNFNYLAPLNDALLRLNISISQNNNNNNRVPLLEFLYLARQPTTQIRYGLAITCSRPHHGLILCVVTYSNKCLLINIHTGL